MLTMAGRRASRPRDGAANDSSLAGRRVREDRDWVPGTSPDMVDVEYSQSENALVETDGVAVLVAGRIGFVKP